MSVGIESLIPHREPMRWIDALIECTDSMGRASTRFKVDHFATENGTVLETALVECMAQTVAAVQGERARARGESGKAGGGMLTAVSNFQIYSRPPMDKPLMIEVREVKRFGPMLLVNGQILCEGERIASGDLTLYA